MRVGVIMESLEHTSYEETYYLHLKSRREKVLRHIQHCTHVLAFDDKDAKTLQGETSANVLWCPPVVSWRDINHKTELPNPQPASFQGTLYSPERRAYVKYDPLKELLLNPIPLENSTALPDRFDKIMRNFIYIPTQYEICIPTQKLQCYVFILFCL